MPLWHVSIFVHAIASSKQVYSLHVALGALAQPSSQNGGERRHEESEEEFIGGHVALGNLVAYTSLGCLWVDSHVGE